MKVLALEGGWHVGPLFVIVKMRSPVRPKSRRKQIYDAGLKQRTPPWADAALIRYMYALAKYKTATTGIVHSVDHIVPLFGGLVSGLHVPWNLVVRPHTENMAKGNRFWPDMLHEQLELFPE